MTSQRNVLLLHAMHGSTKTKCQIVSFFIMNKGELCFEAQNSTKITWVL